MRIETDKGAVFVGETQIDHFTVEPLSFTGFAICVNKANEEVGPNENLTKYLQRERILRQVKAHKKDGTVVPMTAEHLLNMPLAYGKVFTSQLLKDTSPVGEILESGDGISAPLLYRLGTPIKTGTDDKEITELEFQAKTFGDIEDILAAENHVEKTLKMIELLGRPVGDFDLLTLPSWALDQITIVDGSNLMNRVLPSFFE